MVEEAEEKKAPMARIADKAASWLVPIALLIAVISFAVTKDIVRAVTVLVVFCPCALVLATPTAIMAAIGQATKHASAESYSEHPLAKAVVTYAKQKNTKLFKVEDFHMTAGKGISAVVNEEKILCKTDWY